MRIRTISKIILLSFILIFLFSSTIYADDLLLKRGDKSESVSMLQQILKEKGYYDYESITGYYGIITEDAVKAFQADNNLKIDGIAGSETWAALLSETEYTQDVSKAEEAIYSIGMESAEVAQIQLRLKELGFYNYDYVTGYFGSITQKSVSAFQEAYSLTATGAVDSETWGRLFDDYTVSVLFPGTVGDAVIPLQSRLSELGFYSFEIDGYYGEKTKEAVMYFQKASGIAPTGTADRYTQELLYSDSAINEQEARRKLTSSVDSIVITDELMASGDEIAEIAKRYIGYPYVFGGQGPDSFDCDGFVKYVYGLAGYSLPSSIFNQSYDSFGIKIFTREDLQPGDLVFFDTLLTDGNLADHVGIYLGDGYFIHTDDSPGKRAVVIDSMTKEDGWYAAWFSWGRRIADIN